MQQVRFEDAKDDLRALVEAALGGEEIVITNEDGATVEIKLVRSPRRRPEFGSAKGKIRMSEDFDDPLPEFEEYMR